MRFDKEALFSLINGETLEEFTERAFKKFIQKELDIYKSITERKINHFLKIGEEKLYEF